jgi:hypothetical protein
MAIALRTETFLGSALFKMPTVTKASELVLLGQLL